MPKLIGMWTLPIPRWRKAPGSLHTEEQITQVAVDETGQQWGLVIRKIPIADDRADGMKLARLQAVRWVRWEATPFAPDEVVTDREWTDPPRTDRVIGARPAPSEDR